MANWIKTKDELPSDGELVICYPQFKLLVWNEDYECWDDEDGDDIEYEKNGVESWCPIPEYDLKD